MVEIIIILELYNVHTPLSSKMTGNPTQLTPEMKIIITHLSYLIPINYWERSYNKENTKQGCTETLLHFLKKARVVFI